MTGIIKGSDVKVRQAVKNNDKDFNGGFMSKFDVDPTLNGFFPPVSELDAKSGRVTFRKDFLTVARDDDEALRGLMSFIVKPSKHENVRYTMVEATSFGDKQKEFKDYVQSYMFRGFQDMRYALLGTAIKQSNIIAVYGELDTPDIEINTKFCLVAGNDYEYIHVTGVTAEVETAYFNNEPYKVKRQTLRLSDELEKEFVGDQSIIRHYASRHRDTQLYTVVNTDAVKFYGIKPLKNAITQGDVTIYVEDVFEQVIPVSNTSKEYADQPLTRVGQFIETASRVEFQIRRETEPYHFGTAVMPGSVHAGNPITWHDIGNGTIHRRGGSLVSIDYQSGVMSKSAGLPFSVDTAFYAPTITKTASIPITVNNAGDTFVVNPLRPLPTAGSMFVAFRANGTWYTFYDRGDGKCFANEEQVFNFDLKSGTGSIKPPYIPDIGSSIIVGWASAQIYRNWNETFGAQTAATVPTKRTYKLDQRIKKGTLLLTWQDGKTAAETTTVLPDGSITIAGDYAGRYYNDTGLLVFDTNVPAVFDATYSHFGKGQTVTATAQLVSGFIVFDFGQNIDWDNQDFALPIKFDKVAGSDIDADRFVEKMITKHHVGVHTFATGFKVATKLEYYGYKGDVSTYKLNPEASTISAQDNLGTVRVAQTWRYQNTTCTMYVNDGEFTKTKTFAVEDKAMSVKLSNEMPVGANLEPGSIILEVGGKYVYDRSGELHADLNPETGIGRRIGTINYATSEVNLYEAVDTLSIKVIAGLMQVASEPIYDLTWFTPQAPVQNGQFSVVATDLSGNEVIGTTDGQGIITGGITGSIDFSNGIFKLHSETGLRPETVRFNCVAKIISPIDSETLGVQTSRFPANGKVRVYHDGGTVVIHNAQAQEVSNAITAGTTVSILREADMVCVTDANNKHVLAMDYEIEYNPADTQVTFNSNYNAANYEMPITIKHMIYDVWTIAQLDNTGKISLKTGGGGISRDYPVEGTYVSSAIVKSNLQATVAPVKHLKNWNKDWDDLTGDLPIGRYDDDNFKIVVTSAGSINEIWAAEFTGTNDLKIYGKERGLVFEGNTNADIAPINPATNKPYFVLKSAGFTPGFVAGNVLIFHTTAASLPTWNLMSVLIGNAPVDTDTFAKAYLATTAKES